jgi:hypothetical protein
MQEMLQYLKRRMEMTNRFKGLLGFEKTLAQDLSNKIGNRLSNIYLFSLWDSAMLDVGSEVISEAEYIAYCLQIGRKPSESVDTRCCKCRKNKCTGKVECPNGRTVYRIGDESFGAIISKPGYDFANYLVTSKLTTYETVQAIIDSNRTLYERKPTASLPEPAVDTIVDTVHKNDDDYKKWLHQKVTEYGSANLFEAAKLKTLRKIFLDILWQYDDFFDKRLLFLIDNIGIERCLSDLVAHLQKNNRASITAFEKITGIKLPKYPYERKSLLNKTTAAEYTLHPAEYIPRNPKDSKEYSDRFYMWCIREDKKYGWVECRGKLWIHGSSDFFIQKEPGGTFRAFEGRTGLKARDKCVSVDSLQEATIAKINKLGARYEEHIKSALKISGMSPLYNLSK